WIWSQENEDRLGPQTRRLLVGAEHENHVCTISTLELARLVSENDIVVSIAISEWIDRAVHALRAHTVEVSHQIAINAYALPGTFHKDPADRLLVAAARCHELVILTADERILAYRNVRSKDARK